ncbi:DUF6879 family protein [Nocardia sp. CNY236]|uniref:DUF6879 family protein n=1 Tax=Nocardia sp. CNY236 TaxID=1169152 RepID=UPI0003FAABFC|nr:DUF6879 family protein [Nocardia sp. CNY236]
MIRIQPGEHLDQLLDRAEHLAFHLETADDYCADAETASLAAWRIDETGDPGGDWLEPWTTQVRAMTGRGVAVHRARIVTVPHTTYTRYLLALTRYNIAAGEDVRYLPRAVADPDDAAADDFWLLDEHTVAYSLLDRHGRWIGAAASTDPRQLRTAVEIRDRIWSAAIPFDDYIRGGTP